MPRRATRAGRSRGDVLAVEQDLARVGAQEFRQQVEAGGLAGAVGADQRMDAPALHPEVDLVHGHEALELLGQVVRFKKCAAAAHVCLRQPLQAR